MNRTRTHSAADLEAASVTVDNGAERDRTGRFTPGNHAARGRAGRGAMLARALNESVTAEDVQAIAARLVKQARNGSINAAREILDRTIGRSRAVEPELRSLVAIPDLSSLAACRAASREVARAAAAGEIALDDAGKLAALVAEARQGIETAELEARLVALERRLENDAR